MKIPETKMPPKETDIQRLEYEIEQLENRCEDLSFKNRKLNSRVVEFERDMIKLESRITRRIKKSVLPICGFNFGLLFALPLAAVNLPALLAMTFTALLIKLATDVTDNENFLLDGMALGYLTATVVTSIVYLIAFLIG